MEVFLLRLPENLAPLRAPHSRPGRALNPLAQGRQAPESPGAGTLTHGASQAATYKVFFSASLLAHAKQAAL